MRILVACEESQAVTKEFRALGHEAYSCDIIECSGGHPEWHIEGDVTPLLAQKWDMIIANMRGRANVLCRPKAKNNALEMKAIHSGG